MIFSYLYLKTVIKAKQVLGAGVCLSGLVCVVISDLWSNDWVWGGKIYGDVLVMAGTVLYAM